MARLLDSIRMMTKAAALIAVFATLTACGGSDSTSVTADPAPTSPPTAPPIVPTDPVTVVGVQTPDSVAVVTATNAN